MVVLRGSGFTVPPREVVNGSRRCVVCKKSDLHCTCGEEHSREQARRLIGGRVIEADVVIEENAHE